MGEHRSTKLKYFMSRLKCSACGRPQAVCLCPWISSIDNKFHITVLRHKSETSHALNTTEILNLSLSNITVIDGEIFEEIENAALIFPSDYSQQIEDVSELNFKTFILLDGTWRKARKIIYLNPWLEKLPAISLPAVKSSYILRKKSPEGFSTLEATVSLLSQLENDENKFTPLLKTMNQMLQFQIDRMGKETFDKHFGSRL